MVLNTDPAGAELLIEKLGLPFDEVIVDDLPKIPAELNFLWSLPKLSTYLLLSGQERPFLHLDYDFKFWRRPSVAMLEAPAFAQMVYPCPDNQKQLNTLLVANGFGIHHPTTTCNAGVIGGNDTTAIYAAACDGMDAALHPANLPALYAASLVNEFVPCSLIEETVIADALAGNMFPFLEVDAGHSEWNAVGFSHEAGSKNDLGVIAHAEFRLFTEHPAQWRRTRDAWLSM